MLRHANEVSDALQTGLLSVTMRTAPLARVKQAFTMLVPVSDEAGATEGELVQPDTPRTSTAATA